MWLQAHHKDGHRAMLPDQRRASVGYCDPALKVRLSVPVSVSEEIKNSNVRPDLADRHACLMQVRLDPGCLRIGVAPAEFRTSPPLSSPSPSSPQSCTSPNWTIDVSDVRTIKVTNIPLSATAENMKEFFSFSGEIEYVEMRRDSETSQVAYVTFKEFHGADTALLLSGSSMCGDVPVNITPVEDYELPPEAYSTTEGMSSPSPGTPTGAAMRKAEEVVSTMLARGFVLSKDALRRAQSFDERHQQLLSTATSRVASLDRRLGLSDKFSLGTAVARGAARGVDERFQVTERAWGAFAAAGEAVAGSPYASRGAAWVSAAVGAVARAASDVGAMTMEKVVKAEEGTGADGAGAEAKQAVHAALVDVHDAARQGDGDGQKNKAV
ncbi:Binding partner of ACD11 1 [Dichanthelium oligosanthes]|uniref:Binding partner of ACD11 1 n=1 Tax=Dichanthelium oligosanthes TaxID=888268 RepID=A0A1E5WAU7_9POAL|nr:Binding partner of ACD11 1 [Dichanthelium oligosanthes]